MANKAVALPQSNLPAIPKFSDDDLTDMLRAAGAIAAEPEPSVLRMKVDGSVFLAGDEMFPYNPQTKQPAFLGRLTEPIIEYQALWFTPEMANAVNRPDIADRYCKSYFAKPEQARHNAEDGYPCAECAFGPFLKETLDGINKCKWRGDLNLQIIPPSGELTGDEPIWTLGLSTTSVIEFKGTARQPQAGSVSKNNFLHLLAKLGAEQNPDEPQVGVLKALTSYQRGGVVAAFRLLGASSADNSRTWRVISLEPVHILDIDDLPQIEAPETASGGPSDAGPRNVTPASDTEYSDLPF